MYRDHILAWVLGVFDRIKGGARRNMESEKFTEIFEEELGLTKAFLDADIGGRFAESFVISIRTNVSTGDPPEQKLAHVGTIRWNGETVIWIVDDELKARRPLLSEFVKKNTPDSRVLGQIKY